MSSACLQLFPTAADSATSLTQVYQAPSVGVNPGKFMHPRTVNPVLCRFANDYFAAKSSLWEVGVSCSRRQGGETWKPPMPTNTDDCQH